MNLNEFEARLRQGECYHSLKFPPNAWVVLRVDGRSFSRFTEARFEKPFDPKFSDMMVAAARSLMTSLGGIYTYTESDEISMLLPREWAHFDREVEKVVSLAAGTASAAFTLACGEAGVFDGRAWIGTTDADVVDYFRWRHADATRCCLNGWCYWTLRKEGVSVAAATAELERLDVRGKNELLYRRQINFNDVPLWQRRGIGLYHEQYAKPGRNPITGEETSAVRRRLVENRELAMGDAYAEFIRERMQG